MGQNLLLAWPNRTPEATLSGGAWSSTAGLNNLKTRFSYEVARTTNTSTDNTQFDTALDKTRTIKCMALLRHNCSLAAKYRIRLSNTAGDFSSPLYDTGLLDVWSTFYPFGILNWGDEGWWGGKPQAEEITGYPSILLHVLDIAIDARYIRLEIQDPGNPAGYIEATRFWVSGQWQPRINMSYGMQLGWEDSSAVEEALDGTEYFDERPKTRAFTASLDWLSSEEGHAIYLEMQRQLGTTKELLVVPDYSDSVNLIRRSFVGRLRQLSPLDAWAIGLYKGGIEIKETV